MKRKFLTDLVHRALYVCALGLRMYLEVHGVPAPPILVHFLEKSRP